MSGGGGIAVYVTSHGFGHHNRTVAVLNQIPADLPIVIRCARDLFPAWAERLTRPARLEEGRWDVGVINPPGDSGATDPRATIEAAQSFHKAAMQRLPAEVEKLKRERAACVLCDIPPLPLVAARQAGIPGFLLANFTWAEIYAEYADEIGSEARAFVGELADAYRQASAVFRAEPALPMGLVKPQIDVGLVVSRGTSRVDELRAALKIPASDRLVYFYVGRYGQESLDWRRLAHYAAVRFVGFHDAPLGDLPNVHRVPAARWSGADLMASCDAALAKAGYGSVSEAMAARTPLVYPPREGFAEHGALDRALRQWGGGIPLSRRQFQELDLDAAFERAFSRRAPIAPYALDGARRVAEALTAACRRDAPR